MEKLSQNKKIAISAIAVFALSFAVMVVFLGKNIPHNQTQANILHDESHPTPNFPTEDVDEDKEFNISDISLENAFVEIELAEEPLFLTNGSGDFMAANKAFCKLISQSCEKIIGESMFEYIGVSDLPKVAAIHAKLLQEDGYMPTVGPISIVYGKSEKLVMMTAKALGDDEVEEIVFQVIDLTERVKEFGDSGIEKSHWVTDLYPNLK